MADRLRLWKNDNSLIWEDINDVSTSLKWGNVAFIDTVNGDDSTGTVGRADLPYATASAAETAVSSGQTVWFRRGNYTAANLGKNGINYYLEPGVSISSSGTDTLISDGGSNLTFGFYGFGKLSCITTSKLCLLTGNSNLNINLEELSSARTSAGGAFDVSGNSVVNITLNELNNTGSQRLFTSDGNNTTTPKINLTFNNASDTNTLLAAIDGGEAYIKGNYLFHSCPTTARQCIASGGGTCYIDILLSEDDVSNKTPFMMCESNNGGTGSGQGFLSWRGDIITSGDGTTSPIEMQEDPAILEYSGTITYNNVASEMPIIDMNKAGVSTMTNSILRLKDATLINKNQTANSDGINTKMTSAAGQANIEFSNVEILLDSTAVGLGAKAVDVQAGSLNYKAFTDPISNGAFDGTNLISHTAAIVDANAKSD